MKTIILNNMTVNLTFKKIKNIYLYVKPPQGNISVTLPPTVSKVDLISFINTKMDWIKKQKEKILKHQDNVKKTYTNNEEHFFLGKKYKLQLIETKARTPIKINADNIQFYIKAFATLDYKQKKLDNWYRSQITSIVKPWVTQYESQMQVSVNSLFTKKMKTRWGSCNIKVKRIWLNLELAKTPIDCLRYVLVHEMVHLLEPSHNYRFKSLMTKFMPEWKNHKKILDCWIPQNDID